MTAVSWACIIHLDKQFYNIWLLFYSYLATVTFWQLFLPCDFVWHFDTCDSENDTNSFAALCSSSDYSSAFCLFKTLPYKIVNNRWNKINTHVRIFWNSNQKCMKSIPKFTRLWNFLVYPYILQALASLYLKLVLQQMYLLSGQVYSNK